MKKYPFFTQESVTVEKKYAVAVLNRLLKSRAAFSACDVAEESVFTYPRSERKTVLSALAEIPYRENEPRGCLYSVGKTVRPGVIVGFVLAVFLCFLSGSVVWDIRPDGVYELSEDAVTAELMKADFHIGSVIPFTDLRKVEALVMADSSKISYISLHFRGSIAYYEVIATKSRDTSEEGMKGIPRNLVASEDALIYEIAAKTGRTEVKVGNVVKSGDLLVSGIAGGAHGTAFLSASGKVIGRVSREYSVTVPREKVIKTAEIGEIDDCSINFFGFSINIFKNSGNSPAEYDTIYNEKRFTVLGVADLPVSVSVHRVLRVTEETVSLSDDEMQEAASRELAAVLTEALSDSELLSKKTEGRLTEDGYTLTSTVVILTDVAKPAPITVTP